MSKVGESMIQGAFEALKFAQGKDKGSMTHNPESTKKAESSTPVTKPIVGDSSKRPPSTLNCHRKL